MKIVLQGYTITDLLYDGSSSRIFHARRNSDQQAVIVKLLKPEYPAETEIAAWEAEYNLLNSIRSDLVIKALSLERYQNTLFLVLEDFGGQSLKKWLNGGKLPLPVFLRIGIKAAAALEQLHQHKLIYQNMNPSHIVYNPATGALKMIDFSLACRQGAVISPSGTGKKLTAILPYMAPEQTGRMNRSIGRCADLYSLGAAFYELLTGRPPFDASKAEELVYCHLAVPPVPVRQRNFSIPAAVSGLIDKLLAKDPEKRYQSAAGVIHDLTLCLQQLSDAGAVADFPLGHNDFSGQLKIPQKLYGRNKDVAKLNDALTRTAQGRMELLLVTGPPGIGKSALINHLPQWGARENGRLIQGKFDQLLKNTPYHAWVQSFTEFTGQLLTENAASLKAWQTDLLTAVGHNGKLLTDFIPNLDLVIGKQTNLVQLNPEEDQNRFHHIVKKFITAIARNDRPLIIFLDDLQWADMASLRLLDFLLSGQAIPHLLLIGAYRSNEVKGSHPLLRLLAAEREDQQLLITKLHLKNLTAADITGLLADALGTAPAATAKLADLIHAKTRGNPFFVRQFIRALKGAGLLHWDSSARQWQWNIGQIQQLQITDNVVELLTAKIRELPAESQAILKIAACIGHRFSLVCLQLICEKNAEEIVRHLQPAVTEGLLIFQNQEYRFAHDRIQHAVYFLSSKQERLKLHLKIGRSLLRHIPPEQQAEYLFDIADQFNFSLDEIQDPSQKRQLAELNLQAGRQAKDSVAYIPALNYLRSGIRALAADSWQSQYRLTLSLYTQAIETSYLGGDFSTTGSLTAIVLDNAKTLLDKIPVYKVQAQVCRAENRLPDAVQILLPVLTALGIDLPAVPTAADIQAALEETAAKLRGRKIETLADLPLMTAPEKLAAMEILAVLRPLAYQICPALLPLTILAGIHLSLEYGNTSLSVSAYSGYAMVLCGVAEDFDTGYRFGRLALQVLPRLNATGVECKVLFAFNTFARHYKEHFREMLPSLRKAAYTGIETGDMEYGAMAAFAYCLFYLFSGRQLTDTLEEMAVYCDFIQNTRQETGSRYAAIYRQMVYNFQQTACDPLLLTGEFCDETALLADFQETKNSMGLCLVYFAKSAVCYLLGAYEQAAIASRLAKKYMAGLLASPFVPLIYFYDSLTGLALYPRLEPREQAEVLAGVAANQNKLRACADHGPMNYLHKFYLVEAERHRVLKHDMEAMEFYDLAADEARQNDFLHMEALSYELAAEFYLTKGRIIIAKAYMREALYRYTRWGAAAKVKQLEKKHPHLLLRWNCRMPEISKNSDPLFGLGQSISEHIDMQAIMKTALVISKELDITVLCQNILQLVICNAGAEKGCLILNENGKLTIEAQNLTNPGGRIDFPAIPVPADAGSEQQPVLPLAIINYAARTTTKVVLTDAAGDNRFQHNVYLQKNRVRSLLCLPLLNRGKFSGLIYLENSAASGIFTEQRVKVLEILLAQLSISIENARLYAALNQKVKGRTTELESVLTELKKLTEKKAGVKPTKEVTFTNREKDILHLVALGQTNKEMSKTLSISLETVKSHIHNLLTKTGTTSRTALIARELHSLSIAESRQNQA
ncbi:MAG: AAA family ATPase [Veillonellales bacterium]